MGRKSKSGGASNTPAQRTDRTGAVSVLIDWLGFTFNDEESSLDAVLRLFYETLQIDFTEWKPGRRYYEGYANSLVFENINIYFDGASNQGIHVDITGQGCRYVEVIFRKLRVQQSESQMYWYDFIKRVKEEKAKFTRVDIAIDDLGCRYYSVPYIYEKLRNGEATSKFKSWSPDGYFGFDGQAKQGMTIYFGSDVSRFQVCMYEKAKQLGIENHEWTRTELRFRHERAEEFIKIVMTDRTDTYIDIGVFAAGILKDYITFREPNDKDTNKRRWKVSPFWEEFLTGVEPLRLTTALPDRSIMRTTTWFKDQVSKSYLMMELAFYGIRDEWKEEMLKEGAKKLTRRDIEIIEEYRRLYEGSEDILKLDGAIDIMTAKKEAAAANSDSKQIKPTK